MSMVDNLRRQVTRAEESGVPRVEFLAGQLSSAESLKANANQRLALAGRETEEAVRQLLSESGTPEEERVRLLARQAIGDDEAELASRARAYAPEFRPRPEALRKQTPNARVPSDSPSWSAPSSWPPTDY
jgi:hypothetical protein